MRDLGEGMGVKIKVQVFVCLVGMEIYFRKNYLQ